MSSHGWPTESPKKAWQAAAEAEAPENFCEGSVEPCHGKKVSVGTCDLDLRARMIP